MSAESLRPELHPEDHIKLDEELRDIILAENDPKTRPLLSLEVEQELRKDPDLIVAGVIKNFDGPQFKRNSEEVRKYLSRVDIICAPVNPEYNPVNLDMLLRRSIRPRMFQTEIKYFSYTGRVLYLGKGYFDQTLGFVNRRVNISIDPERNSNIRDTFKEAGIELAYGDENYQVPIEERTTVHLYPDKNCAEWFHEYFKSPSTWNYRRDFYDPSEDFFKRFTTMITMDELIGLQKGVNIFDFDDTGT